MAATPGIAASGHPCTAGAARQLLAAGGNAFDAALGALCAATVAEPLLASLGGGGFMLARTAHGHARVYDFFTHTPARKKPREEIDFHPILADFGTARQEFHVGMGAMAVPGLVAGLFEIHSKHGRLPIAEVFAPAIELARAGVEINPLQHSISLILAEILAISPAAQRIVATRERPDRTAPPGERVRHPDLADTYEALAAEGPRLFYEGEPAQRLVRDCRERGGMLEAGDLARYRVVARRPVRVSALSAQVELNAPPSPGGCLLAFALRLLEDGALTADGWGSPAHCLAIARAIHASNELRREALPDEGLDEDTVCQVLGEDSLRRWRRLSGSADTFSRGTTHMGVVDDDGNIASMTVSNGEGCGYVLPGTGVMMNNMLGEEDLNPRGFHAWTENTRLASMMCPTIARLDDGRVLALGSGGSNRIRSAVLQVLVNRLVYGQPLETAVNAPRMHLEGERLSLEHGYPAASMEALRSCWPDLESWPGHNLFFGGVHAVEWTPCQGFRGAGDARRGGAVATQGLATGAGD